MNKLKSSLLSIASAFLVFGCAHTTHKVLGPESADGLPSGVPVQMGGKEAKEGDRVNVFQSMCRNALSVRAGTVDKCSNTKVGEGTVIKVLGRNLAIIKPDSGTEINEKMTVEKQ